MTRYVIAASLLVSSVALAAYYVPTSYGGPLYEWMDWGTIVDAPPIRMNAGTPIQMDRTRTVTIRFNQREGTIEFAFGGRVLGYLVADASASGGRMN